MSLNVTKQQMLKKQQPTLPIKL